MTLYSRKKNTLFGRRVSVTPYHRVDLFRLPLSIQLSSISSLFSLPDFPRLFSFPTSINFQTLFGTLTLLHFIFFTLLNVLTLINVRILIFYIFRSYSTFTLDFFFNLPTFTVRQNV
jgi:hypothetical protein